MNLAPSETEKLLMAVAGWSPGTGWPAASS